MTAHDPLAHVTSFILEEQTALSLDDLSRACAAQAERIVALVQEGALAPDDETRQQPPERWHFTGVHLQRAQIALRLQDDLGLNPAGAALALELLDELKLLRARLEMLEPARH